MTQEEIEALRAKFAQCQCPNVVAMIDYLSEPEAAGKASLGLVSIGLERILGEPGLTPETRVVLASFQTGLLRMGVEYDPSEPFRLLANLSEGFGDLPLASQETFDQYCQEMVVWERAPRILLVHTIPERN